MMDLRDDCTSKCTHVIEEVSGSVDMGIYADNGITNHEFIYGAEKEKAKKMEADALANKEW